MRESKGSLLRTDEGAERAESWPAGHANNDGRLGARETGEAREEERTAERRRLCLIRVGPVARRAW